MTRMGKAELNYGNHWTIEQTLQQIDDVTREQVGELACDLLRRPLTAAVVGPYAHDDDLPHEITELIA
jgi:predicted Zn-dependent peptidase